MTLKDKREQHLLFALEVRSAALKRLNISLEEFTGPNRSKKFSIKRQLFLAAVFKMNSKVSYSVMSEVLGRKYHTTAIFHLNTALTKSKEDFYFNRKLSKLIISLNKTYRHE